MSRLPDSFAVYQGRISALSRPSREEESEWIAQMRNAERTMIGLLIGIGHVARHLTAIARRITLGEERADRWLRTRKTVADAASRSLLAKRLDEVQRLFEACEQLHASGHSCDAVTTSAVEALISVLTALNFKHRVIESVMEDMLRLESSTRGGLSEEEVRHLEQKAWMPLAKLRHQVSEAHRHHREAQEVKWRLVGTHLWIVPIIARGCSCSFLSFMDLVQEGNLGLIRAAENCGEGFDCRFSSYAAWWIRQSITRAIESQERLIRLPSHVSQAWMRLARSRHVLEQAAGREVEDDEVAWHAGMPLSRARHIFGSLRPMISIHEAVSADGDGDELEAFIADDRSATADSLAAIADRPGIVNEMLSALNAQEREVLTLRFGLHDGTLRTMEEIGLVAGLTKQRIQQIESRAFAKLRHPARLRRLARWM